MGVWICAKNKISIVPEVDDKLIQEYILFSEQACPPYYYNEKFANTWFFNTDNKLVCIPGKSAEPSIWFDYLKEIFFEPRGYVLSSAAEFVGEGEKEYDKAEKEYENEYKLWQIRKKSLTATIN